MGKWEPHRRMSGCLQFHPHPVKFESASMDDYIISFICEHQLTYITVESSSRLVSVQISSKVRPVLFQISIVRYSIPLCRLLSTFASEKDHSPNLHCATQNKNNNLPFPLHTFVFLRANLLPRFRSKNSSHSRARPLFSKRPSFLNYKHEAFGAIGCSIACLWTPGVRPTAKYAARDKRLDACETISNRLWISLQVRST